MSLGYPTSSEEDQLYLHDADAARLRRLAAQEGSSQAEIVRKAIGAYEVQHRPDRQFVLTASGEGDGRSVADIPEEELLEGFGADPHN